MSETSNHWMRDGDRGTSGRPGVCCAVRGQMGAGRTQITYVLLTSGDKGSHDADMRPGRLAAIGKESSALPAADLGVGQ